MILYSYWFSSCASPVRFGLNHKGLQYEYKAMNLLKGEQSTPEFKKLNPIGYVLVLVDGNNVISDSFAICWSYLEEKYPQRPLLPVDHNRKAINYQKFIEEKLGPNEKLGWDKHHMFNGFKAFEKLKDHA